MRVKGFVGKNVIHVFVDSGSTHNFLDLQTAKRLGCNLRKMCPLEVSVANGNVMTSLYECKNFTWEFQGIAYTTDVMILPLGGCDMVLGIQWLSTVGCILCDFKKLVMEYTYKQKNVVLRDTHQPTLKWIQGKQKCGEVKSMAAEISMM